MGTENSASVFQLGSGMWAFRYTYTRNGKRVHQQYRPLSFDIPFC